MTIGTAIGDEAPSFDLRAAGGGSVRLADLRGRRLVLYFYPKADTSGCTAEATAFQAALPAFEAAGATVVGISKDPVRKLDTFAAKSGLTFLLASDPSGAVVEAYGAWVEKSMYGRAYMGIDRSTFLIDRTGRVEAAWRKVKVPGHVGQVLAALSQPAPPRNGGPAATRIPQ